MTRIYVFLKRKKDNMAKKNDWIHLDKTSGTGPAEVKVTADINAVSYTHLTLPTT